MYYVGNVRLLVFPMGSKESYKKWYENNKSSAREQKKLVMRRLRQENPEKYNLQSRNAKVREKLKLFEMYGHECAMCGFNDKRALSLDHKLNNGNEERRLLGERGVYRKAKEFVNLDEYQILCMNCQFIKRSVHAGHIDLNIEWLQQHSQS